MKTQPKDKATPSALALKIAKQLYPNGLPNVSYCWDTEAKNEMSKQADRNYKAEEIDKVLQPEHALLNAVAEAAKAVQELAVIKNLKARNVREELKVALSNLNALRGKVGV